MRQLRTADRLPSQRQASLHSLPRHEPVRCAPCAPTAGAGAMSEPAHLARRRARPGESAPDASAARGAQQILAQGGPRALRKELQARLAAMDPRSRRNRPKCGARCQDGHACRGPVVPGRTRCYHHGGLTTGPRTPEGLARSAANLAKTPSHMKHAARRAAEAESATPLPKTQARAARRDPAGADSLPSSHPDRRSPCSTS